jgi:hypothetical protein
LCHPLFSSLIVPQPCLVERPLADKTHRFCPAASARRRTVARGSPGRKLDPSRHYEPFTLKLSGGNIEMTIDWNVAMATFGECQTFESNQAPLPKSPEAL